MSNVSDLESQLVVTFLQALLDPSGQIDLNPPATVMSLTDLIKAAPEFNISYALKTLAPTGSNYDKIVVNFPAFYPNMSTVLSKTSSEVIQAFFIWKAASTMAPYVVSNVTNQYVEYMYQGTALDPALMTPRWKQCIDHTDTGVLWLDGSPTPTGLSWILGRFFIEKAYSRHAREFTYKILTTIQQEFISRLHGKKWVSDQVKRASEDKVDKILRKVGYPDISPNITDPLAIKAYYADVNITDSHFWNALSIAKSAVAHKWAQLSRPMDKNIWQGSVSTCNAYYNAPTNEIAVFAGIQQFPLVGLATSWMSLGWA